MPFRLHFRVMEFANGRDEEIDQFILTANSREAAEATIAAYCKINGNRRTDLILIAPFTEESRNGK